MEEVRYLLLQTESGEILLQVIHASAGGRELQTRFARYFFPLFQSFSTHNISKARLTPSEPPTSAYFFVPISCPQSESHTSLIQSSIPTYNEFRHLLITNTIFQIAMNYSYDLWEMEPLNNSVGSIELFYEPDSHLSLLPNQQNLQTLELGGCPKIDHCSGPTQPEAKETAAVQKTQRSTNKSRVFENHLPRQKTKQKKKFQPSPYHNYQKHLNTTLKNLIVFPPTDSLAPELNQIASQLWSVFLANQRSATKKILHFIFNQFNEYSFKVEDLQQFGFKGIYSRCSHQMLAEAKNQLTNVAVSQLNDQNIDKYLATRRIKNPLKFKRYLLQFKKELLDGFLKKRFTNRSRKEQMRKEISNNT